MVILNETAAPPARDAGHAVIRRVWLGVGSSAMGQAILAAQAILLVPLFLRAWGADGYGRWLALTALVSNLSLLDLGGQNYIGNLLAMEHARGDEASFRKRLSEGVSLFLLIGIGMFAVVLIALSIWTESSLPGLNRPLTAGEAGVIGLLAANWLLLSIPGGVYVTAYRSTGLFARGTMVGNAVRLLGLVASALLLAWPVDPVTYAAGILATGSLGTLAILLDTRNRIPGCLGLKIGLGEARGGWSHLHGALYFWLMSVSQALLQQGVLLVLAFNVSPVMVAAYATHRTLSNIPGYIGILFRGPLWPELSFLWAQKRFTDIYRVTYFAIRSILLATGATALLIWLAAPLLYPLWTGRQLEVQPLLLGLLLLQGVLAAGWMTASWGLLAANKHRPLAMWSAANACITFILTTWLAPRHGIVGAAIAGLAGDLLCGAAVFPILASSFLGIPTLKMHAHIGWAALAILPIATACVLAQTLFDGWLSVLTFVVLGMGMAYPLYRFFIRETGISGSWWLARDTAKETT